VFEVLAIVFVTGIPAGYLGVWWFKQLENTSPWLSKNWLSGKSAPTAIGGQGNLGLRS